MAAFSKKDDITIPATPEDGQKWGWEPHETVTIKGTFNVGDMEAISTTIMDPNTNTPSISVSSIKMLHEMITAWNFTDDQHRVAVINEQTIAQLPMNYVTPILECIDSVSKKGAPANPLVSPTSANELSSTN
jgi:hypothetical protein